jgi:hypothetical protein
MVLGASCAIVEMVVADEKVGRKTRGSISRAGCRDVRIIVLARVPCV